MMTCIWQVRKLRQLRQDTRAVWWSWDLAAAWPIVGVGWSRGSRSGAVVTSVLRLTQTLQPQWVLPSSCFLSSLEMLLWQGGGRTKLL